MAEDLIILVADRRLTWSDGRLADDNFTKVVVWRDCFAVAFTGIARINATATKSTSEWIAEVLADYRHFDEGVAALQRRASEQLASLPKWPDMRLGMVVAGFDFRRYPRFALVSNYLPGGPYPADPTDFVRYSMMREVGPGVRSAFATAGVGLENWQEVVLGRPVPRILRQHDGITRAAKIMVALQRKVADKQSGVGRDAMCVVIPRERRGMRESSQGSTPASCTAATSTSVTSRMGPTRLSNSAPTSRRVTVVHLEISTAWRIPTTS